MEKKDNKKTESPTEHDEQLATKKRFSDPQVKAATGRQLQFTTVKDTQRANWFLAWSSSRRCNFDSHQVCRDPDAASIGNSISLKPKDPPP
ncbi:hypothetical protein ACLKA6_003599 [Drosophila palustris]